MNAAVRVFIFFSAGYFVSYVFRGLNIGFAPFLTHELNLTAADLGSLTSLYFLGFALTQIPAGAALDTWGPRRVTAVLMVLAALGSLIFALGDGLVPLMVGRVLIGVGVAVCMGAGLQALAQNFPAHRVPLMNGALIAIGGLGGALVGTPLALVLDVATWRMVSIGMAAFTLAIAGLIWFGAVDARPAAAKAAKADRPSMWSQFKGTGQLLCSSRFWKLALFPSVSGGMFYAVQSLWMKPYLLDVNQAGQVATDALVSLVGLSAVCGSLLSGVLARKIERLGMSLTMYCGLCLVMFVGFQCLIVLDAPIPKSVLWGCFGLFGACSVLVFAILVTRYPAAMWGRVNTTFNMLVFFMIFAVQNVIGWIVELWKPVAQGVYPATAHVTAWICLLAIQVVCAVWYFWPEGARQAVSAEAA